MDRPLGGWSDLATNQVLDAKLDAVRFELRSEMSALRSAVDRRLAAQTWITTTTLIAGLGLAFSAGRVG